MPEKTLQPAATAHELGYTLKTVRITTGSIAASSQAEISVTWPSAFPNTNYTVIAMVEEGTAATDNLKVLKIVSRTATGCVVRVQNVVAAAVTGTLHLVAIPD